MKKKKYLETKFLKFLLERQKQLEDDEDLDIPKTILRDEEDDTPVERRELFKNTIGRDEDDESSGEFDIENDVSSDEEILEKLLLKYKILKSEYENKLLNRRRG